MSTGRMRWALLLLPFAVGALLLMHGLDADASIAGEHGMVEHHDHGAHDEGCSGCLDLHAASVCVGVVVAAVAVVHAGRRLVAVAPRRTARSTLDRSPVRALIEVLRPPEPAWVRLAVMRC